MITAHVVNAHNKHLYENEFDEFLRRRHDFFVHQKHWRPPSPDGRELDQFDTDAATYLLGIEDGRVVTSARLIPTSEPHMVSEVFSHMCEKSGVPRRPDWAEWTRTFVVPDKRTAGLRGTLTQLCCAVMEYALDEGLSAVGGIQETYFMPHHGALKWRAEPMGMAREENGEWYIVAYIEVNEAALASVRKILGIGQSLLVRRGMQVPFIDQTRGPLAGYRVKIKQEEAYMAVFDPNQSSLAACLTRIDEFRKKNKISASAILTSKDVDIWKKDELRVKNIPDGFNKAIMPFYTDGPATFYVSAAGPGVKVPRHSHKEGAGIRFIVGGSISYGRHELKEGDWMYMPAGSEYEFVVGPRGVIIFYCYQCCCA